MLTGLPVSATHRRSEAPTTWVFDEARNHVCHATVLQSFASFVNLMQSVAVLSHAVVCRAVLCRAVLQCCVGEESEPHGVHQQPGDLQGRRAVRTTGV